jgi:signal transduction histidine kinase
MTSLKADDPRRVHPADERLIRVLGSKRASLAVVVIVFAAISLQALANPVAILLDGPAVWDHPLPLGTLTALVVLACALQSSALFISTRAPVTAAIVTTVLFVVAFIQLAVPTWITAMAFPVAIAMFLLAAQRTIRVSLITFLAIGGLTVTAMLLWALSLGAPLGAVAGYVLERALSFVAPVAGATALGIWWGIRSHQVAMVQEAAEQATRDHAERVERARFQERSRIAQELHDVAGQHIAGLLSLADAALTIEVREPAQALSLIEDIRAEGRFASASLYAALRDLRAVDGDDVERTPDLSALPDLAAFWTQRGINIELRVHDDTADLPAIVSTTAYRAVQEGLTNAAKHARGAEVAVDVVVDHRSVRLVVVNTQPSRAGDSDSAGGLGWGLEALTQRAELLGGTFNARPTPEGGWLMTMEIPVPEQTSVDAH